MGRFRLMENADCDDGVADARLGDSELLNTDLPKGGS